MSRSGLNGLVFSPFLFLFFLLSPALFAQFEPGCYAVLAGRGCTRDGAVLLGHNEDDHPPAVLYHWYEQKQRHAGEKKLRLVGGGTLPQVKETYGGIWSQMLPNYHFSDFYLNERGVGIASNACASREDKPDLTAGGITFMLRRIVAHRAATARQGIEIATSLLNKFGYGASGRTMIFADPKEAWVLCMARGKHYVAARVPDDRVCVMANAYPIHEINREDRENWICSPGLVEYAIARGWYDPDRDGEFQFCRAYSTEYSRTTPRNFHRQFRGIKLLAKKTFAKGPKLPLFITPKHKVCPADFMAVLRDKNEMGSQEKIMVCNENTRVAVVMQLRSSLPIEIGAVLWIALGRPDASPFMPWYPGGGVVPPGLGLGDPSKGLLATIAGAKWNPPHPPANAPFLALARKQDQLKGQALLAGFLPQRQKLEQGWFASQAAIEACALELGKRDPALGKSFLAGYTLGQTQRASAAIESYLE